MLAVSVSPYAYVSEGDLSSGREGASASHKKSATPHGFQVRKKPIGPREQPPSQVAVLLGLHRSGLGCVGGLD